MYVDDSIHIEKSDQCYSCEHFLKGSLCPLLEALALGVVELTEEMTVQNCSFYKKFNRHLRVVDVASSPDTDGPSDDDNQSEPSRSCM